ncbi:putative outer membrane protein [Pseudolycoriella hygida]|uniref:Outer membrane protein n=1 Tax=Pseudolycoriella hygida TaxID=35572 RepID=A0A9Q0S676_9DIPT|nr:putative outer membrane protein [Pseudolycoriella hygida]
MIRLIKGLGIFLLVSCISVSGFAINDEALQKDGINYYENEGNLILKIRGSGIKSEGKEKGSSYGSFFDNGYGAEAATSMFFSPNIAAELSLGVNVLRVKESYLLNVAGKYAESKDVKDLINNKGKRIFSIPLTLLGQFHIAPFGGISPYVGAGYHGAYMFTKSKAFKIKSGFGPVLQAGIDFYAKDNTLINLDVKQYFLKGKVDYKAPLVKDPLSSTIKLNPLLVSFGIGFKF